VVGRASDTSKSGEAKTELLITGLHHDLSRKRSFVHFIWKNDPERRLGLDVPFECTLDNLPDEARKTLKALSKNSRRRQLQRPRNDVRSLFDHDQPDRHHRPLSGDETRRRLSAFMRAAAGVVQPVPGLLVGPARNREVRRGGNRLAGTDGNTPMRARRRFEAMHRRGVGGSTQSDQQAQGQNRPHRIAPVGIAQGLPVGHVRTAGNGAKL
jgi:hypothetical protein